MRRVIGLSLQLMMLLALGACANDGVLGGSTSSTNNPGADDDDGASGDDDDDGGPAVPYCEIVWIATGSSASTANLYVVEVPMTEWTTGTKTFGDTIGGIFLYEADEEGNAVETAEAANGSFELTVAGTNVGDAVQFSDLDAQTYDGETQTGVADDGRGDFDGVLSDPEAETPPAGTGSIAITYAGASLTIGDESMAYCSTTAE